MRFIQGTRFDWNAFETEQSRLNTAIALLTVIKTGLMIALTVLQIQFAPSLFLSAQTGNAFVTLNIVINIPAIFVIGINAKNAIKRMILENQSNRHGQRAANEHSFKFYEYVRRSHANEVGFTGNAASFWGPRILVNIIIIVGIALAAVIVAAVAFSNPVTSGLALGILITAGLYAVVSMSKMYCDKRSKDNENLAIRTLAKQLKINQPDTRPISTLIYEIKILPLQNMDFRSLCNDGAQAEASQYSSIQAIPVPAPMATPGFVAAIGSPQAGGALTPEGQLQQGSVSPKLEQTCCC